MIHLQGLGFIMQHWDKEGAACHQATPQSFPVQDHSGRFYFYSPNTLNSATDVQAAPFASVMALSLT